MLRTLIALLLWWQPLSLSSRSIQGVPVGGLGSEVFYSLVVMSGKQSVKTIDEHGIDSFFITVEDKF